MQRYSSGPEEGEVWFGGINRGRGGEVGEIKIRVVRQQQGKAIGGGKTRGSDGRLRRM